MIKVSDYIIQRIAEEGVGHIFMLPGGGCMHLVDSLGRNQRIKYVCNLHEQACAIAAEAYAQYTNDMGVALVTTGPGGTNAITGVAAAWLDSTPMLVLSGQVKRADLIGDRGVRQMGFQELDIVRMVTGITKYAVTVTDPLSVRFHLEKAFHLARTGRPGPVWLDIPLDVQAATIEPDSLPRYLAERKPRQISEDRLAQLVDQVMAHLRVAKRPAILLGNGVRLAGAGRIFLDVTELLKVPVLTTWKALDLLPDDHPLFAGRPGAIGQRGANFALQAADLLLVIGARLDLGQTGYNHKNFAPRAKKIIVDIDEAEINKLDMPIELPVCADARAFLSALASHLAGHCLSDWSTWINRCQEWRRRYPVMLPEYSKFEDGISIYALVDALSEQLSPEDLIVPGSSGACSEVTMQAFRVKAGQRVFNSEGLGPMGFGVPAALGGCIASGGRRTVCIDGDGGFHMNLQELETIRRLALPIKFFVLDNGGYESIRATQRNYFDGRFTASSPEGGLTLPPIGPVVEGYGIAYASSEKSDDLWEGVHRVLSATGPIICRVKVSSRQVTAPRISSKQLADGTMVSTSLEDMWPFLDADEL